MHRRALISAALTAPFLHGCSEAADRLSAPAVTEGLDAGLLDQADVAAAELRRELPGVEVTVSELRTDPWDFVVTQ